MQRSIRKDKIIKPVKLNYSVFGEKNEKSILFLHGFMGNREDWMFLVKELQDTIRCILIDLPGHGSNLPQDTDDYTFGHCADFIISILQDNEIEKCNIVGYSMGGRLGLFTCLKYPENFNSIVMESVNPGIEDGNEKKNRIYSDKVISERIKKGDLEKFLDGWFSNPIFGNIREDEKYQDMIKARLINNREGLANSLDYLGTGKQPSMWSRIHDINKEILYIAGENDRKFKEIGKRIRKISKHLRYIVIEGAGHNTHFQQPEIFIKTIKDFFIQQED